MAITKTRQDWTPGNTVKVGFLTLRVIDVRAVYDGLPDIYTLESCSCGRRREQRTENSSPSRVG